MGEPARHPGRLLEMSSSYWEGFTLHAGVKLDLFTRIAEKGPLTGAELAEIVRGDERRLTALLNALTAMGLLTKTDDAFSTTDESATFLSKTSEAYVGHIIMHHHHLVESWNRLDEAVTTGSPTRGRSSTSDESAREHFLMGMFNIAMQLAPRVTTQLDLGGRERLLDLGGGPGTWAIHFCLANAGLTATVFDLPTTQPFAKKTIERFGLADRVRFQGGDFLEDSIEGRYDAAWLSHILHSEGPETCQRTVNKAVAALEPGGLILIHEFVLNDDLTSPLKPALFSLNMIVGTPEGRAYSEGQLKSMLNDAGCKDIERLEIEGPNTTGIIAATV